MSALRKIFLSGTALAAVVVASGVAFAADVAAPVPAASAPSAIGDLQLQDAAATFGGQVFINKPGNTPGNSSAKFNQYGDRTDPVYLSNFNITAENPDASVRIQALGKNVGTNNQAEELDISQPGRQYFEFGFSAVPNLRSNTAETLYNGVGSTNLTVPNSVVNSLYDGIFNSANPTALSQTTTGAGVTANAANSTPVQNQVPGTSVAKTAYQPLGCYLPGQTGHNACAAGVTPILTTIQNNVHQINMGIQRDDFTYKYTWTPAEDWTMHVDYTHDHRYGVQEQGFLFNNGTSGATVATPAPVDDTTDNASLSAEYYGITPWGKKFNISATYSLSLYRDAFSSFTAESPFGGPGSVSGDTMCITASSATSSQCTGIGRMATAPNNGANSINLQGGVDLPSFGFKSNRFMGTFAFSDMEQNSQFMPMTISALPIFASSTMPRGSLQGRIDTLLSNNVLSTQINSEWKNKLTYRYYSNENNTPAMTLASWVSNDTALYTGNTSYNPRTPIFSSYIKQNASDEVTWTPANWATFSGFGGWERYDYTNYAANTTNEFTGKLSGRVAPTDWLAARASVSQSVRRYDNYNYSEYVGYLNTLGTNNVVADPYQAEFNIANRNRTLGNAYLDWTTPIQGLTITPTAGIRWDTYPTDYKITSGSAGGTYGATPYQLGLQSDHNVNFGVETSWAVLSNVTLTAAYTRENQLQKMFGSSNGNMALGAFTTKMGEKVDTVILGSNISLIPDVLSLRLSATAEFAKDDWGTGALGTCPPTNTTTSITQIACGITSAANPAYPSEYTKFGRLDGTLSYKINEKYLEPLQLKEAVLSLHYGLETNSVSNWQQNGGGALGAYMYSVANTYTVAQKQMIFMGGDNPNYRAQLVSLSASVKW